MESMHVTETYPGDNFMVKDSGGESGHIRFSYLVVTCMVIRKPPPASGRGGSDLSRPDRSSLLVRVGSGSLPAPPRHGRAPGRGRGMRHPVRGVGRVPALRRLGSDPRDPAAGRAQPLPGRGVAGGQGPCAEGWPDRAGALPGGVHGRGRDGPKKQAACLITDVAACVFRYIRNEVPSGWLVPPFSRTRPRTLHPRAPDAPSPTVSRAAQRSPWPAAHRAVPAGSAYRRDSRSGRLRPPRP